MFKNSQLLFAIAVLVLASLACQAVTGGAPGGDNNPPAIEEPLPPAEEPTNEAEEPEEATEAPADDDDGGETGGSTGLGFETEYPIPADAANGYDLGNGMISFQTKMNIQETLEFYRAELSAKGYTEYEITTSVTDTTLNLVFDGHESGNSIVVQAVDLGDGTVNITIRLEKVH